MNRHLKERIVGATVIVAFGIIVIPWLLDGPAQAPESVERTLQLPSGEAPGRVYSIPLDPGAGPPVQLGNDEEGEAEAAQSSPAQPSGVVQRPSGESPPALEPPVEPQRTAPVEQPSQPPPRPAPRAVQPDEQEPAPSAQATADGDWAVQVGSFSQADNARKLRGQLADAGFDAFVSRVATDAGTMHRVRVGPVAARADAEKLLARLRSAGHQGARVVQAAD